MSSAPVQRPSTACLPTDGTAVLFAGDHPSSTLHSFQSLATIPEAAWELFLGVYCTIWGFRRAAPILAGNPS